VMMRGGLTASSGAGVAQTLKVRLIHAMIRNLILRGEPESVVRTMAEKFDLHHDVTGHIAALTVTRDSAQQHSDLFQTLFAHGWNLRRDALPCNQEELAYTLLTFNYVFLRGLRSLRLALSPEDESAYLHTWNVMAHVLGIEHSLMPQNMNEAAEMFNAMQTRGRDDAAKRSGNEDPRQKLGQALMKSMEDVIAFSVLKGFPSLLTKRLCGDQVAQEIGILGRASATSTLLFVVVMGVVRMIDIIARLFATNFSLSRMLTRVLGYHLMCKLMMDQARPLKLPQRLLSDMSGLFSAWSSDPKSPGWVNALEDHMTTQGDWYTVGVLNQKKHASDVKNATPR
jgi:hypothetical protein